jgi:putative DNA primase/helicase
MYSTPTGSDNLHTPSPGPALLDAALSYAARGWHVFPCHTPTETGCSCRRDCDRIGKHPRTKNGLHDATTDPATIRRWWKMWPQANLAVRTGAVSGLAVLDQDTGKGGDVSLRELERTYSPLPETVQDLTGNGVHYVFTHPGTHVKNGVETLGMGLDVRGDGGYVITPPSLHMSGKRYAWELRHDLDETSLAPMPAWLLALCQDTTRRQAPNAGDPSPQGSRNETLFKLGCSLRARGCTEAVILAALREMNATQCQPPLAAAEVDTIAASCAQYSAGQTREDTHQRQNDQPTSGPPSPAAARPARIRARSSGLALTSPVWWMKARPLYSPCLMAR